MSGGGLSENDTPVTPGVGSTAYKQVINKENVVVFRPSVADPNPYPPQVDIIPYTSVAVAKVDRSSYEAEDPVDALCKPEEGGGGALGLWKFNETLNLAPTGTEWHVTWTTGGFSGESIKFGVPSQQGMPQVNSLQLCSSSVGGCLPMYADGIGWASGTQLALEVTGGDDIENPDFVAWLNANATAVEPEKVSGCWQFNDEVSIESNVTVSGEFTSNGQTFTSVAVNSEALYYADGQGSSTAVYSYSLETYQFEWTDPAYKDICFTGETSLDPAVAQWLYDNATKVN